jgi:hypothetical protein
VRACRNKGVGKVQEKCRKTFFYRFEQKIDNHAGSGYAQLFDKVGLLSALE